MEILTPVSSGKAIQDALNQVDPWLRLFLLVQNSQLLATSPFSSTALCLGFKGEGFSSAIARRPFSPAVVCFEGQGFPHSFAFPSLPSSVCVSKVRDEGSWNPFPSSAVVHLHFELEGRVFWYDPATVHCHLRVPSPLLLCLHFKGEGLVSPSPAVTCLNFKGSPSL